MKKFLILLSLLLLITSCSINRTEKAEVSLYFSSKKDLSDFVVKKVSLDAESPELLAEKLFAMLSSPEDKSLTPLVPKKVKLNSVSVSDGICTLTLSDSYTSLPASEKALFNLCVTKALCSADEIEQVDILSGGKHTMFTADDFLTELPGIKKREHSVTLYFSNRTGDGFITEKRQIAVDFDQSIEEAVVLCLANGIPPQNAKSPFPSGTKINDVYVSDGICFVDVSEHFVKNKPLFEKKEHTTLYSVVNTLTGLPMINSVKFLIDGNDAKGYSYFDISKPLLNSLQ